MSRSRHLPLLLVLAAVAALAAVAGSCSDRSQAPRTVTLDAMQAAAARETDAMASLLSRVITYPSIEPAGPGLLPETAAMLDDVLAHAAAIGFRTRRAAGGLVGVLEYGGGAEVVGALIHLDVVAPGDLAGWDQPPFSGAIVDGRIYGRGAQDDKSALVGVLYGAKILIDEGMTFDRGLRIILGTKEETSFEDMQRYFAEEAPPDFGIVPDGPFLIRAESGYADVSYVFTGLEAEPGERGRDTVVHWQGGSAVNSVPDFSWAVVRSDDPQAARAEIADVIARVTEEFRRGDKVPDLSVVDYAAFAAERDVGDTPPGDLVISSRGMIAHSSIPQTGRNAIVEVALVGARLTQLSNDAFARAFAFVDEKIGLTTNGSGFDLETDKPIPAAADTTASLDLVGTTLATDRVELVINYRVGIANTTEEILQKSGDAAASYGASLDTIGTVFNAYYYPDDDPLLNLVLDSYREVRGTSPPILAVGSTTYVKAAPNLISYGPVDLGEDGLYFHTVNEQFPVASLTRNAVLFAHVLQEMIQAPVAPRRQ